MMPTPQDQGLIELFQGHDDLVAGQITEREAQEVGDFWEAQVERMEYIGDDWLLSRGVNLAEPMTFNDTEVEKFCQRHVCALCGARLVASRENDGKFFANCPAHGPVFNDSQVHESVMAQVKSDRSAATMELNVRKGIDPETVLRELGF